MQLPPLDNRDVVTVQTASEDRFYLVQASFAWRTSFEDMEITLRALDAIVRHALDRADPLLLQTPLRLVVQKMRMPHAGPEQLHQLWRDHMLWRFQPPVFRTFIES